MPEPWIASWGGPDAEGASKGVRGGSWQSAGCVEGSELRYRDKREANDTRKEAGERIGCSKGFFGPLHGDE